MSTFFRKMRPAMIAHAWRLGSVIEMSPLQQAAAFFHFKIIMQRVKERDEIANQHVELAAFQKNQTQVASDTEIKICFPIKRMTQKHA